MELKIIKKIIWIIIETSWFNMISVKMISQHGCARWNNKTWLFLLQTPAQRKLTNQVPHNAVKPMELGSKAAQWVFVKCSWIIMILVQVCLWERERCILFATVTEVCTPSTYPPPVFHQIHKDTIQPKVLWKSQNTPLPHSHLPTKMITFRVLTLAHNHSFDQSKTFSHTLLDLLFFLMEWFLPDI